MTPCASQTLSLVNWSVIKMESAVRLQNEELLFFAACVCNCWCVCLCVCVCLEGRACRGGGRGAGGKGGGMRTGSSWRWQLSRTMRLVLRWCRLHKAVRGGKVSGRVSELWSYSKVLLKSLYYNSLSNSDTLLDCVFEPVYWIVDNVTRWFGVVRTCPSFCLFKATKCNFILQTESLKIITTEALSSF